MPMYEYGCAQCGKKTEIIQKFSDAPLTHCPACGGPIKRLISASGIILKGGGWYKDGYTSSKGTPATSEATAATSEKPVEKGNLPSEPCSREGEAPWALPMEGTTRAPVIETPTCEKTGKPADASCACATAAKTTTPTN